MKFYTKLYVGFGMVLLLAGVISLMMITTMSMMNDNMVGIVNDQYRKVSLSSDLRKNFDLLDREVHEVFIIQKDVEQKLDQLDDSIMQTVTESELLIQELDSIVYLPEVRRLLDNIISLEAEYYKSIDAVMLMLRDGQKENAIMTTNNEVNEVRKQLVKAIYDFKSIQEGRMKNTLTDATNSFQTSVTITILLGAILFISSLGIAIWSITNVRNSLKRITIVLDKVKNSDPEHLPRIPVITKDEIGSIAEAYNRMADSLEEQTLQQQKHAQELQEQHWLKSMIAEMTTGYQGIENVKDLADWFINRVTPMIGANYGVFYIKKDALVKMASYAGDGEDVGESRIQLGEGLIGQCSLEQRIIMIEHPPADYIRVKSGIGHAPPAQIIIMPITYKGITEGVIELASFRTLTDLQMSLLKQLMNTLGLTIASITGKMQVQKLLNEAQVFTEELQTQSEELQQQQEELTTLNDRLGDQFERAERKTDQLEGLRNDLEAKNAQLLLASEYKSEFLANISHELRTPLNSLLILSQILADNKEANLLDKQVEYVRTIHSSGNELLKLINEILDLSKIESGKMDVVFEDIHLKELMESITQHVKVAAERKGISFHIHMGLPLEQVVLYTDAQKLEQILKNLLSNATKFTEYGSVHLSLYQVTADHIGHDPRLDANHEWIAFEIKDTGIGISQDKLEFIFESFQQADGTTSRKYGGTGLGLAISQQLAELLNGFIHVHSEIGFGSAFTVYLPLIAGPENPAIHDVIKEIAVTSLPSAKSLDNLLLHGKRILLVDDDMRNIYALTVALENVGLQISFAENGVEGLQMLQKHTDTDLVLMDIMMPKMDGYQAIRAIREMPNYSNLPIIALTAKAMKEDRAKCIEAGANDYISKPVHIEQLLSLIQVWLYR